jgi:hypothetical protein
MLPLEQDQQAIVANSSFFAPNVPPGSIPGTPMGAPDAPGAPGHASPAGTPFFNASGSVGGLHGAQSGMVSPSRISAEPSTYRGVGGAGSAVASGHGVDQSWILFEFNQIKERMGQMERKAEALWNVQVWEMG